MATQNPQAGRVLEVIPSDNSNIPFPDSKSTGTNTSTASLKLISSGATFRTLNVKIGDIVYNTSDGVSATVTSVDSETQLTLNANIFSATGKTFYVYDGSMNNRGCCIYTGVAGTVKIQTAGGDIVTITGAVGGEYHPINSIIKVFSTGTSATNILALW